MAWTLWLDGKLDPVPHLDPKSEQHTYFFQQYDRELVRDNPVYWAKTYKEATKLVRKHGAPAYVCLGFVLQDMFLTTDFLYWLRQNYESNPPMWGCHEGKIEDHMTIRNFMVRWINERTRSETAPTPSV